MLLGVGVIVLLGQVVVYKGHLINPAYEGKNAVFCVREVLIQIESLKKLINVFIISGVGEPFLWLPVSNVQK